MILSYNWSLSKGADQFVCIYIRHYHQGKQTGFRPISLYRCITLTRLKTCISSYHNVENAKNPVQVLPEFWMFSVTMREMENKYYTLNMEKRHFCWRHTTPSSGCFQYYTLGETINWRCTFWEEPAVFFTYE